MSNEKSLSPVEAGTEAMKHYRELAKIKGTVSDDLARSLAEARVNLLSKDQRIEALEASLKTLDAMRNKYRVELNDVADGLIVKRDGKKAPKWAWRISARIKDRLFSRISNTVSED